MDRAEEDRRVRMLRTTVDLHLQAIAVQPGLSPAGAMELLEAARALAARLFPDKGPAFELIYAPRFERAIRERFGWAPAH